MQAVCLITDLHIKPPISDDQQHIDNIKSAVVGCDVLVYSGDILTMDHAGGPQFYDLARTLVEDVGKPFMFTLGNHDGGEESSQRMLLRQALNASALHVGRCDTTLDACMHPELGIATLV